MEERTLGRTGLRVTRIGLGLAALGRPGYVNLGHASDLGADRSVGAMKRHAHGVLDAAWRAGVGYLDAARSYGRAEAFLASWLASRGVEADDLTIGTKWGYTYTADWRVDAAVHEVKDHSLATLRRQWRETRDLLDGHVDLLQVHSATLQSGILDDPAVHDELARLRADGEVRAIGASVSGPEQPDTMARAMEIVRDGRPLFDVFQATWSALEPSAGPILAVAHAQGFGVIVKEALANGRLVRGEESGVLQPHADRLGTTTDALALAFALEQPWVDVVLSGASTGDQLRSNVRAGGLVLDDAARSALGGLARPAAEYWTERAELPWN